eukprot:SM000121S26004  [mRNA]  locus=s121:246748:248585:- [translate_table: standard]
MELPCLPFSPSEGSNALHQVFVPASSKTLHLYEARFLALLDEVLEKTNNLFAHIVVEAVLAGEGQGSFVASYGCLAIVENVRRLTVGALVTVRGIGRIKLLGVTQLEPFLRGRVVPVRDEPADATAVSAALGHLRSTLADIQLLQIKLKSDQNEVLQTPLERALLWADKVEVDATAYYSSPAERVAFAALQPVTGATAGELHKLLQRRLEAMETVDSLQRLALVTEFAEQSRATLAAKVALQSLRL